MARFILRYAARGGPPPEEVRRVRALARVKIVDETPAMFLVEAAESDAAAIPAQLPGWIVTAERTTPRPDPRPRLKEGG